MMLDPDYDAVPEPPRKPARGEDLGWPRLDEGAEESAFEAVDRHIRLVHAIESIARTPEGVFLLSYLLFECGLFTAGGDLGNELALSGKRSVAVNLLANIRDCPSGQLITARVMQEVANTISQTDNSA